ncbi:MAG: hypothetical protein EPN26_03605 [Rhodospirillales bacterium]|nr:MAG: hypothetical protein EPN26_03605 [Rhodospirillales bacterium]
MSGLFADFMKRLLAPAPKAPAAPPPAPPPPKERPMTPERAELIGKAMEIYRQKQAVLAELDPMQRQMLLTIALKAFFNKVPSETKDKKS